MLNLKPIFRLKLVGCLLLIVKGALSLLKKYETPGSIKSPKCEVKRYCAPAAALIENWRGIFLTLFIG